MTSRRAGAACLLLLAYLALALLFTYPLAWHFGTHHVGEASGDAKVYLWNYWWVKKAVFELGTSPFETTLIFHPIGIGLSLHTLALSQGVLYSGLSEIVPSVVAANAIVLWTFVATALATYGLARRLGAPPSGAFLAGLALAYCPYRLSRLSGHYDLLGTEWIPLYVLLLIELSRRERFPWMMSLLTGAAAALCGYTVLSYLAFLALFTVVFLAFHAKRLPVLAPRVGLAALVCIAMLSPLLERARRDLTEWSYPPYPGADRYVTDLAAFFVPPPQSTVLPGRGFHDNLTETTVFPGYVLLLLAALGWRHRFWCLVAAVFFVLSLGSSLHVGGVDTGVPLPFWIVSETPVLDNLRAPSRLTIVTMLALAMMMALSWRPRRRWVTAGVAMAFVAEYLAIPVPLFRDEVHEVYRLIADVDETSVVEIPGIEQSPQDVMNHQRFHERPVFVGTAARVPVEKSEYWLGLPLVRPLIDLRKGRIDLTPELVARERDEAPHVARFLGLGDFVIDKAYAKRGVVDYVEHVLPVDRAYEDATKVVLRARRDELPPDPVRIPASGPRSRQHFESGWMRPEAEAPMGFRWAHRKRSTILFRRPPLARMVVLDVAPLEGGAESVTGHLNGTPLGTASLEPGWQEIAWSLPESSDDVERLTLSWSRLARASERDPRRLAARLRQVRFVERAEGER